MIEPPPSLLGAVHETDAWLLAGLADTLCGADGAVPASGVTAFDGEDAGPEPAEFDPCTTNV